MWQVKITGREWHCCSLYYSLRKTIRGHETLTHTFTKRIGDKKSQNNNQKKLDRKKKAIKEKS